MNIRHTLLLLIFPGSLNQVNAQVDTLSLKENHKLTFSISGGVALPVGKFSTFETTNPDLHSTNIAGGADIGYNAKFQMVYLFTKTIGMSLMFYSSINKSAAVDSADLFYVDPNAGSCPCNGIGGNSNRTSYTSETKDWHTNAILAGIVISSNVGSHALNFRINGGVQKVQSPESHLSQQAWTLNGIPNGNSIQVQPSMISYNFILNSGIDLQVFLAKRLGIITSIDFLVSHASFSGQPTYSGNIYNSQGEVYHYESSRYRSFSKNISLINFNLGLNYRLQ
jgi:hypothetical protein